MHLSFGLPAITLVSIASFAAAQECPAGYAPISTSTTASTSAQTSTTSDTTTTTAATTTTTDTTTTSATTTTASTTTSAAATPKSIVWVKCATSDEPTLECGTVDVPADWSASSKKRADNTLTLPVVRIPAKAETPRGQSIIYNPGGPGASGINDIAKFGSTLQTTIGDEWHLVSFDPRGVGLTTPYKCQNVQQVDGSNDSYDTDTGLQAALTNAINQGNKCAADYKAAGELVGTAFVARDINAIAQALGEDGFIRYWGFSYGTLLGATLSAMFPDKMDRVVLDGNINPTDYYHGLGDEAVDDVDAAIKNYFVTCAAAGADKCAVATSSDGDALFKTYTTFLDGLSSGNIQAKNADGTDAYYTDVLDLIRGLVKYPDTTKWAAAAKTLKALYASQTSTKSGVSRRDAAPFNPIASAADLDPPQTLNAVTCGDWYRITGDLTKFKEWRSLYRARSKYQDDSLLGLLYTCSKWQIDAKEKTTSSFTNVVTKNAILFVNSPFDPVTPLISGQNSQKGFTKSALLVHNGAGHCSGAQPSKDTVKKVKAYFATGDLPDVSKPSDPDTPMFQTAAKQQRRSTAEAKLEAAIAELPKIRHGRDLKYDYPAAFSAVRRDVFEVLSKRGESPAIPAGCTPIIGTTTTTSNVQTSTTQTTTVPTTTTTAETTIASTTGTTTATESTTTSHGTTSTSAPSTSTTTETGTASTTSHSSFTTLSTMSSFDTTSTSSFSHPTLSTSLSFNPSSTTSFPHPTFSTTSSIDTTSTSSFSQPTLSTTSGSPSSSTTTTSSISRGTTTLSTGSSSTSALSTTSVTGPSPISTGATTSSKTVTTSTTTTFTTVPRPLSFTTSSSSSSVSKPVSGASGWGTWDPKSSSSMSTKSQTTTWGPWDPKSSSTTSTKSSTTSSKSGSDSWGTWDPKSSTTTTSTKSQSTTWGPWDPKSSSTTSGKTSSTSSGSWTTKSSTSTKPTNPSSSTNGGEWGTWTTSTKTTATAITSKTGSVSSTTSSAGNKPSWSSIVAPVGGDPASSTSKGSWSSVVAPAGTSASGSGSSVVAPVTTGAWVTSSGSNSNIVAPTGTKAADGASASASTSVVKPWTGAASSNMVPGSFLMGLLAIFGALALY